MNTSPNKSKQMLEKQQRIAHGSAASVPRISRVQLWRRKRPKTWWWRRGTFSTKCVVRTTKSRITASLWICRDTRTIRVWWACARPPFSTLCMGSIAVQRPSSPLNRHLSSPLELEAVPSKHSSPNSSKSPMARSKSAKPTESKLIYFKRGLIKKT